MRKVNGGWFSPQPFPTMGDLRHKIRRNGATVPRRKRNRVRQPGAATFTAIIGMVMDSWKTTVLARVIPVISTGKTPFIECIIPQKPPVITHFNGHKCMNIICFVGVISDFGDVWFYRWGFTQKHTKIDGKSTHFESLGKSTNFLWRFTIAKGW